jgi:hypothetical protein
MKSYQQNQRNQRNQSIPCQSIPYNIYTSPLFRKIPIVSPPPPMQIYIPLGETGLPYQTPEYKPHSKCAPNLSCSCVKH